MERGNKNKGFTLVELITTVAILALVVSPFLIVFARAQGDNLDASQKQNTAKLAEDIAEEFKSKSIDVLKNEYTSSESGDEYTFTVQGTSLPKGIRDKFYAKVKLEPSTNPVNDPMATLTNMSGSDTMLLMSAFYANDSYAQTLGAEYRKSTIKLSYDNALMKYVVRLEMAYFSNTGMQVYPASGSETLVEAEYDNEPAVFAIYTPMSVLDEVYFKNELELDEMEDAEGNEEAEFYFALQYIQDASGAAINFNRLFIEDDCTAGNNTYETISSYLLKNESLQFTKIHSNKFGKTPADLTLVKNIQSNKLYDLTVEVYYDAGVVGRTDDDEKYSTFTTSRLHLG